MRNNDINRGYAGYVDNSTDANGTHGGEGVFSKITGTIVGYCGGGSAGSFDAARQRGTNTETGQGSGGNGQSAGSGQNGTAGVANRGGGSGSEGTNSGTSGNTLSGGSGVVIIRIASTRTATFSGGVTSSVNNSVSGYKIYSVTATSSTNETVTFS